MFLGGRRVPAGPLLVGDDEHEVLLAPTKCDDGGVGVALLDLHGGVVQQRDAVLADGQPQLGVVLVL